MREVMMRARGLIRFCETQQEQTYRRNDFVKVDIFADDGGIITAKLKGTSLQGLAAALHHHFSNGN